MALVWPWHGRWELATTSAERTQAQTALTLPGALGRTPSVTPSQTQARGPGTDLPEGGASPEVPPRFQIGEWQFRASAGGAGRWDVGESATAVSRPSALTRQRGQPAPAPDACRGLTNASSRQTRQPAARAL